MALLKKLNSIGEINTPFMRSIKNLTGKFNFLIYGTNSNSYVNTLLIPY